jgi:hypothetical protein
MKSSTKAVNLFIFIISVLLLVPCMATAGQLTPSAPPASTMHSLDEIHHDLQLIKGNLGLGPRFVDNGNGTVTDTITKLIWLKNANPCGLKNWSDAIAYCNSLASGQAGLTDGSIPGQWRLPTKSELEGIGTNPPATWDSDYPAVIWTRPSTPFLNVQYEYWSSTEMSGYPYVWYLRMSNGFVGYDFKTYNEYVWPIRSGQ